MQGVVTKNSFHVIVTSAPQMVALLGKAVLKNERIKIRMKSKPVTEIHPEKLDRLNYRFILRKI